MIGRAAVLACATAAVTCALIFVRPHATPGPPMRDFEAYYAAGATANANEDPYSTAIWTAERKMPGVGANRYAVLPFVGPPATLAAWAAFARLNVSDATLLWRALLVAAALVLLCAAAASAGRVSLAQAWPLALVGIGFGPLTSALALGQLALPACACAAVALALGSRRVLAAIAALFACAQPNIAITLAGQLRRAASGLPIALGAAAFTASSLLARRDPFAYLRLLHAHGLAERFAIVQVTPLSIAFGLGASAAAARIAQIVLLVAAVSVWLFAVRRLRDDAAVFCAGAALLPFAMPFFHEHDLTIELVPAIVLALRCSDRVLPWVVGGALCCATDWLGLAQRPDGTLQTLLLVGSCAAGLLALRTRLSRSSVVVALCVLAAIAIAGTVAQSHPAPVWPDAMRALAPDVRALSISAAWHAELQGAGQFQRDSFFAALRCLSLGGAAVLAACAFSLKSSARPKTPSPVPA